MDNLNHMDDIEQRIQSFHASLRADFLGKVQEVATLHDEMAKLQTRLLDVEQENHMLKIQLALAKAEGKYKEHEHQLQPTSTPPAKKEVFYFLKNFDGKLNLLVSTVLQEEKPTPAEAGRLSKTLNPPLKHVSASTIANFPAWN